MQLIKCAYFYLLRTKAIVKINLNIIHLAITNESLNITFGFDKTFEGFRFIKAQISGFRRQRIFSFYIFNRVPKGVDALF